MNPGSVSLRRTFHIAVMLLVIGLSVEIGARGMELVARLIRTGDRSNASLYVEIANPVPVFEVRERDGQAVYVRTKHHRPWIHESISFAARKAPNTLRVFCLGGSAAQGWPFHGGYSYPGILARKLTHLLPDTTIEVINVAGFTYASHRVKFVFDEIIEYEPDLVLLYSGNNEFLEDFVYRPRSLGSPWRHLAVARIVHRWLLSNRDGQDGHDSRNLVDVENYGAADQVVNRLSFAFGRASKLRRDPAQFAEVQAHYRHNVESMIVEAARRDVPLMVLTVPINLKDWMPNVSIHDPDLPGAQFERWTALFREGLVAMERGDFASAVTALDEAVSIDPHYAEAHYLLGVSLHRLRRIDEARQAYLDACATDAFPFRSPPQLDRALRDVVGKHAAPLIDIRRVLSERAADGIPGLDVMIDYVHPRVASNEAIADAVLHGLVRTSLLPASMTPAIDGARMEIPPGVDETFRVLRGIFLQYLNMRQYDKLDGLGLKLEAAAERVARSNPEMVVFARSVRESTRHTRQVVRDYRRLLRAEKLGRLEQEFTAAEARSVFGRFVELIREIEGRGVSHEQFEEFTPELEYGGS